LPECYFHPNLLKAIKREERENVSPGFEKEGKKEFVYSFIQ